ncbi:MAG: hypothetical protein HLUCCA11_24105 [Phormidesmis priestleyi Ana]|uniref:Uncharacterized protein n=1 Tax=Phormidesmis priestleyi Ana TaxID=1666911 RepID=A0A0P8BCH9_9CYAN|nr:MAG: hypothetical protein HLUCCA11_24105 [Phormidesmis priestleyi Ana]
MTFYRDRADGPIHAVEFSVVDEGETTNQVEAIHLKGVPQAKLRQHIQDVLGVLKAEFGQNVSITQERQPVALCPLCLKGEDREHSSE